LTRFMLLTHAVMVLKISSMTQLQPIAALALRHAAKLLIPGEPL
jgi:hypothetical protein